MILKEFVPVLIAVHSDEGNLRRDLMFTRLTDASPSID